MPPRSSRKAPKLPPYETDVDNVVRQEQAKGTVRPDGPGDATAPIETESSARRSTRTTPRKRGIPLKPSSKVTPEEKMSRGELRPPPRSTSRAPADAKRSSAKRAPESRSPSTKPRANDRASKRGTSTAGRAPVKPRATRAQRPAR